VKIEDGETANGADKNEEIKPKNAVKKTALKPGQKHPTPTSGAGDRVFYETLLRQNPKSIMAQEWCLAYGVLQVEEATKLFKKISKSKPKTSSSPPRKKIKVKSETKDVKEASL